jgi:methyl-accepting chemotaxis protein
MNSVSIIKKFLAIVAIFAAFTISTTIFSVSQMWHINSGYSSLFLGTTSAAFDIAQANRSLTAIRGGVADLMVASNDEENRVAEAAMDKATTAFSTELDQAAADDPASASTYLSYKSRGLDILNHACGPAIKAGEAANTPAAALDTQSLYKDGCAPAFPALVSDLAAKSKAATDDVVKKNDALTETSKGAIAITLLLIVGGLVAVSTGGVFAIRAWVVTPILRLSTTMAQLAKGDLDAQVPGSDRGDEIGAMSGAVQVFKDNAVQTRALESDAIRARARSEQDRKAAEEAAIAEQQALVVNSFGAALKRLTARDLTCRVDDALPTAYEPLRADFNGAMAQLQDTIKTVVDRTHGLRSGGTEISQASDDLSKRTEQQAASLEETAAALDQITATVKKTADGALEARKVVSSAKAEAEKSSDVVREAVEAMGKIEHSSRQIGQIIGAIDEIAFQTNLLALNAGVEAARAGDSGRGFAVVASEVRALAQRSAVAAKEIKALVSTSATQVANGVDRVGETGKALTRIAGQVTQINGVVAEIAASAQEQATGLHQVNAAVNQMDQVTQQNAAMVEEATAAAHSLREETDALSELVGQFRVGDGGFVSVAAPTARLGDPKRNPVHAVQRKMASALGGRGRAGAGTAAPASDPWEEF